MQLRPWHGRNVAGCHILAIRVPVRSAEWIQAFHEELGMMSLAGIKVRLDYVPSRVAAFSAVDGPPLAGFES